MRLKEAVDGRIRRKQRHLQVYDRHGGPAAATAHTGAAGHQHSLILQPRHTKAAEATPVKETYDFICHVLSILREESVAFIASAERAVRFSRFMPHLAKKVCQCECRESIVVVRLHVCELKVSSGLATGLH